MTTTTIEKLKGIERFDGIAASLVAYKSGTEYTVHDWDEMCRPADGAMRVVFMDDMPSDDFEYEALEPLHINSNCPFA